MELIMEDQWDEVEVGTGPIAGITRSRLPGGGIRGSSTEKCE